MDRNRVIIGVVLLAVLTICVVYFFGWFWVGFALLTIVEGLVACGLIYAAERYYEVKLGTFFEDNDTWFFVLAGMTAVTFVIALFNFGPAVLLPETYPTPEQRGTAWDIFQHILYGNNADPKEIPTGPLPWAHGTWFWWKATGIYALLTFGYFWFAFWDEASAAVKAVRIHYQTKRVNAPKPAKAQGQKHGKQPANGDDQHDDPPAHFWKPDFWDIIAMLDLAVRTFRGSRGA